MSFVLFFRGMIAALLVFSVTIYFLTDSFWTALWQTIACAVLIQVGYFLAVLFMIWRSSGRGASRNVSSKGNVEQMSRSDDTVDAAGKLPVTPFTRRP